MKMKRFIISLGGSLLYEEDKLDIDYIIKFTNLMRDFYNRGYWFGIVVGGGNVARYYQKVLKEYLDNESLDWVGIRITHLNAEVIRLFIKDIAYEKILIDYENIPQTDKIIIGGGWLPGCSTDYDAAYLAYKIGVNTVINLTKVDGIFVNNKLTERLSWMELEEIIPNWEPGLNFPIDPKAAEFCKNNNIKFIVINGRNLENLRNIFENKKFIGTVIE